MCLRALPGGTMIEENNGWTLGRQSYNEEHDNQTEKLSQVVFDEAMSISLADKTEKSLKGLKRKCFPLTITLP